MTVTATIDGVAHRACATVTVAHDRSPASLARVAEVAAEGETACEADGTELPYDSELGLGAPSAPG